MLGKTKYIDEDMTDKPSNNSEEQLENFFAILTGNNPETQGEKLAESAEDKSNNDSEFETKKKSTTGNSEQELEVLQQLLGKSEIDKLKDRVFDLEVQSEELVAQKKKLQEKCKNLEAELERQNEMISLQTDGFSKIINESLKQLKQDLLIDINLMLEEFVEDNIKPREKFSIKVTGLQEKK